MKKFSKSLEAEIKFLINDVEYEDGKPSRKDVIRWIIENADDPDHYDSTFRKELNQFGIEIGIYKEMTQQDLDNTIVIGHSKKKYDFKLKGKFYKFDSWKPLENLVDI